MWMLASAVAGVLLALLAPLANHWRLMLIICSAWLVTRSFRFLNPDEKKLQLRSAFFYLIAYTLAVMILLTLQALL